MWLAVANERQAGKGFRDQDFIELNTERSNCADGARVYVVDDDRAVRNAISLLVQTCGWQAIPCSGALEFFERYSPSDSQCVVLDLQMPHISGEQVLCKLRAEQDDVPVVIVTADPDDAAWQRAYKHGVLKVLNKPSAGAELEDWIRRALGEV